MMGKISNFFSAAILGFFVSIFLSTAIFHNWSTDLERKKWHQETIARDLALYYPKTGNWAWKGECDE
jgi:hypothetical protein